MTWVMDGWTAGGSLHRMGWKQEYLRSIKAWEVEDRIDLIFYRPLGFLVAKLGERLGLYPTHVTVLGALAGVLAGALFLSEGANFLPAAALLLFAGVLDSADGQLARLTGRSTAFGLVLDGLCDNIVFAAVYIGCTVPLMHTYGWWIWLLALPAGACHSVQSALLDFYNREYLFYTGGPKSHGYWNPLVEEARLGKDWFSWLRLSWLFQQQLMSTRDPCTRLRLREAKEARRDFGALYRKHNLALLHAWRPLGANIHTLAILVFAAIGKFELYLLLIDLVILNIWLCAACWAQSWADRAFLAEAGILRQDMHVDDKTGPLRA
jgi:hypothetical protein